MQSTFTYPVTNFFTLNSNQIRLLIKLYHKKYAEFRGSDNSYDEHLKNALNPKSSEWFYERNFCDFEGDFEYFIEKKLVASKPEAYHTTFILTEDGIKLFQTIATNFLIFNNYYFEVEKNGNKTIYTFQYHSEYWNNFKLAVEDKEEYSEVKCLETYDNIPNNLYYGAISFLKDLHKNLQ